VDEEKQERQEKTPTQKESQKSEDVTQEKPSSEGKKEGEVKKAHFSTLTSEQKDSKPININFLMDISLDLSIELGRAILDVKDILSLRKGSVVELNKLAGDPVDIYVNNKFIARGEVVVIDDNFGVRVTDILSPAELLNNLKSDSEKR